jgi:hypothetical protein
MRADEEDKMGRKSIEHARLHNLRCIVPCETPMKTSTTSSFWLKTLSLAAAAVLLQACTQEQQNKIQRDIQNWTGTNGVLEVYAGDKLVRRFVKIDKLSTAMGTDDNRPRPYRFGYGVLDENLNMIADPGEKRVYFEISDYASNYVFFENPR